MANSKLRVDPERKPEFIATTLVGSGNSAVAAFAIFSFGVRSALLAILKAA